jgi:hypothetical protein
MWSPVPWFVAGGDHPPEVARLLAHVASGGDEGVIESTDCKVTPLLIAGKGVLVNPGAVSIPNRASGARRQSYLASSNVAETVTLSDTPSSGPRTDLIIARIEDPAYMGTGPIDPEDAADGPYIFTRVVEGVPANTTRVQDVAGHANDSAITLARVTRPAQTGTVLQQHITDLREMAASRQHVDTKQISSSYQVLPSEGEWGWPLGDAGVSVAVPRWATHVEVICWISGIVLEGAAAGDMRVHFGGNELVGPWANFDENAAATVANPQRFSHMASMPRKALPAGWAGTARALFLGARRVGGSTNPRADGGTTIILQTTFSTQVA